MNNIKSDSLSSVSCMHVIEHIGLGRYGDPINQNGDKFAINEIFLYESGISCHSHYVIDFVGLNQDLIVLT